MAYGNILRNANKTWNCAKCGEITHKYEWVGIVNHFDENHKLIKIRQEIPPKGPPIEHDDKAARRGIDYGFIRLTAEKTDGMMFRMEA